MPVAIAEPAPGSAASKGESGDAPMPPPIAPTAMPAPAGPGALARAAVPALLVAGSARGTSGEIGTSTARSAWMLSRNSRVCLQSFETCRALQGEHDRGNIAFTEALGTRGLKY